jgi:hypothetical protein
MSFFMWILTLAGVVVVSGSLLYTIMIIQEQKVKKLYDSPIPKAVQEHPYVRNPVIWTVVIGTGLVFFYIFYEAVVYGYL